MAKKSAGISEPNMHVLFAIGSALLLLTTIYAFYQDQFSRREFPEYQKRYHEFEVDRLKAEQQKAGEELKSDEVKGSIKEVKAKIKTSEAKVAEQKGKIEELQKEAQKKGDDLSVVTRKLNFLKADYDQLKSRIDSGKEKDLGKLAQQDKAIQETFAQQFQIGAERDKALADIAEIERQRTTDHRDLDALQSEYNDLSAKVAKTEGIPLINAIKEAPGLNFIQPNYEIKQVVLENLPWSVFFSNTRRVDRCMSCHLGIDNPDPAYAGLKDDKVVLKSHPRLDLFAGANSKHPYKKFGCTICHGGQHSAVDFSRAAHSPRNAEQEKFWKAQYNWKDEEFWDAKMLPMQHVEASCAKCHKGVDSVPEAATLNEGRHLFRDRGCVNCHMGNSGGPEMNWVGRVGPDLRRIGQKTNLDWARNWIENPWDFRPSTKMPRLFGLENHRDKAYEINVNGKNHPRDPVEVEAIANYLFLTSQLREEPASPPKEGNIEEGRKLYAVIGCVGCHSTKDAKDKFEFNRHGPDLSRVGEKLYPGWLYKWLKNPNHYWAETKMPNLRLSDEEASNLTSYLMSTMKSGKEIKKPENFPEEAFEAIVIDKLGTTTPPATIRERLKNPLEMLKTSLRTKVKYAVSNSERRDTGDGEWTEAQITQIEKVIQNQPNPNRAAKLFFTGEALIQHHGCFGCHNIQGWTYAPLTCVNLNGEVDKDLDKFDFGKAGHDHSIPETKWDWLYTKIARPRVFDRDKEELIRPFDRLRMPWFGYRENKATQETAAKSEVKSESEGAAAPEHVHGHRYRADHNPDVSTTEGLGREEIEKIVTYLLSLTNEPVTGEMQYKATPRDVAADHGRRVIRELNCTGCHMASIGTGKTLDGPATIPLEALVAMYSPKTIGFLTSPGGANGIYLDEDLVNIDFNRGPATVKGFLNINRGTFLTEVTSQILTAEYQVRTGSLMPWEKLDFRVERKAPKGDDWVEYGSLVSFDKFKEITQYFFASEADATEAYSGGPKNKFPLSKQFVNKAAYERLAGTAALNLSRFETERRKSERKFYEPVNIQVRLTRGEGRLMKHIIAQEKELGNDNASQQQAPPSLSYEGGKVQPDWLYGFLHNVRPLRAGLRVRMPSFWTEGPFTEYKHVYPAGRLSAVDPEKRVKTVAGEPLPGPDATRTSDVPDDAQEVVDFFVHDARQSHYGNQPILLDTAEKDLYDFGRRLVMEPVADDKHPQNVGMGCVLCHSVGNRIQPEPKWAPNLANVKRRLREDWVGRFIIFPQAIYPWTNMPANFFAWTDNHDFNDPTRGVESEAVVRDKAAKVNAVRFFLMHSGDAELGAEPPPAPPAPTAPPTPSTPPTPPK